MAIKAGKGDKDTSKAKKADFEDEDLDIEDEADDNPDDEDVDVDDEDSGSEDSDEDLDDEDSDVDDDESDDDNFVTIEEALRSPQGLKAIQAAEDKVRTKLYRTKIKPLEAENKDLRKKLVDAGISEQDSEIQAEIRSMRKEIADNKLAQARTQAVSDSKGRIIPELIQGETEDEIEASIARAKAVYKRVYSKILNKLKAEGWEKKTADREKQSVGRKRQEETKKEDKYGLSRMRRVPRS